MFSLKRSNLSLEVNGWHCTVKIPILARFTHTYPSVDSMTDCVIKKRVAYNKHFIGSGCFGLLPVSEKYLTMIYQDFFATELIKSEVKTLTILL